MDPTLLLILGLVVVILLALAAFGVSVNRVSFGWLGLALWAFIVLVLTNA